MGRKSSKRCCIFHKQRAFGESSTDSSDYDSDQSGSSAAASGDDEGETGQPKKAKKRNRKIAHKKKIPDSQRFHA
jgi:protein phosphatase 1 regulatory subunit 11